MPLFARRERRILLWLVVAATCWRWFLAVRTSAPTVQGCTDLWLAERLAAGHFGDLAGQWWQPWWALALAPMVALGAEPLIAAQVLAAVLGGLTLWPAAVAAERLREGAGLPAAVLVLAAALPAQAAAAGSAVPMLAFAAAMAAAWAVGGRWLAAALLAVPAVGAGVASALPVAAGGGWFAPAWSSIRASWSVAAALAVLSTLPPRPRRIPWLWLAVLLVLAGSLASGRRSTLLPIASPWIAILAGVGLARLSVRLRDVVLVVAVGVEFLSAWRQVEPPNLLAERLVGTWLRERLAPGQVLVGDLPRVAYYAGQRPVQPGPDELLVLASQPEVVGVVLSAAAAKQSTLTAALAGRFVRQLLPSDLGAGTHRHLVLYWRRE